MTCTPQDLHASIVQQPVVVFEVISSDTARTDRIEKLREYQATGSIQRYVILEQTSIGAAVFVRMDEHWIAMALTEADTLSMPELGIEVPLKAFYAGLEFTDQPADEPEY